MKAILGVVSSLAEGARYARDGKYQSAAAKSLTALGHLYKLVQNPEGPPPKLATYVTDLLRKVPKLRGFADVIEPLHQSGAVPDVLKAAGAILDGNGKELRSALKSFETNVRKNPKSAGVAGFAFVKAVVDLLPEKASKAIKRVAVMAAGKVPGIGVAVNVGVAFGAAYDIYKAKTPEEKRVAAASALSAFAGSLPGYGTAVSIGIDSLLILNDLYKLAGEIDQGLTPPAMK